MSKRMNDIDWENYNKYMNGQTDGFTCQMCDEIVSLNDSISSCGWNLICCTCAGKMAHILGMAPVTILGHVQKTGNQLQGDYTDLTIDCIEELKHGT